MMLTFRTCIHVILVSAIAISVSISRYVLGVAAARPPSSSSSAITVRRINFVSPSDLYRADVVDFEFPSLIDITLIIKENGLNKMFFQLIPSAETNEAGLLTEQVLFSLQFSCPPEHLQEISMYYIKEGAESLTHENDVTFDDDDGKWQLNFEPRRLYPGPASGEELELFSKVNVFDPSGKQYSAVVKWPCFVDDDNSTICIKDRVSLQEGDVEDQSEG